MEARDIEQYVSDAICGRPYGFSVGESHFYLHPVTLGKMHLLHGHVEMLEMNIPLLQMNMSLEVLRLAKEKREVCLSMIAIHTCKTKDECFDTLLINERVSFFDKNMDDEDIASLMIIILSYDKTEEIVQHFGMDKEANAMRDAMRAKESKNSIAFGGRSPFGNLLDAACERYGWTKDYVVWGIDYSSLKLMLADKVTSVYLTDEELKRVPASVKVKDESVIKASKETMAEIKSMGWR